MAALKGLIIAICSLGAVALMGLGVHSSLGLQGYEATVTVAPKISVRGLPNVFAGGSTTVATVTKPAPVPVAAPEVPVVAVDAGVAAVGAEVDAGAVVDAGVAAAVVVDAGVKAPAVPAPAPVVPAPVAAPVPAPVVAKPPAPATASGDGVLNLQASDTADVFVDGKRMGASPVLGVKVKVGAHKVRFDCYDAAGNTVAGAVQNVTAVADKEVDVSFACPASE